MSTTLSLLAPSFYPTTEDLAYDLQHSLKRGDVNQALLKVQAFVQACILDRRSVAKVFGAPLLDSFCQAVGRDVLQSITAAETIAEKDRVDSVVLATELYRTGGHTAVIEDLIKTGRFGPRTVIMLTDALCTADPGVIAERFGTDVSAEVAPAGSLADKLSWTLERLLFLQPHKLVLMNHHHDPIAVAAAQPSIAEQTIFYHHGDHQLCLGVTLEHTLHVDPHPMGFHNCREAVGVQNPIYWPLIAEDQGTRPDEEFMVAGVLRTCSSGSHNKFEGAYKYAYSDVLPRLMQRTGGEHVHIGPLSTSTLNAIRDGLVAEGIPTDRFVHVPWVKSVWKALHTYAIDVYIASFPLGGGKAMIEAMGAGIPVIGHHCYISPFFGGGSMFYPGAFLWSEPEQLLQYIGTLTPEHLRTESIAARCHYEKFHTMETLVHAIDAGIDAAPPDAARRHVPNALQSFLDDVHYALQDHLTSDELKRQARSAAIVSVERETLHRAIELETTELVRLGTR